MKYTFQQFKNEFPDDGACLQAIFNKKYGNTPACTKCGVAESKFHRIKERRAFACQWCGHHVYPCVGTPFEKSSTSLSLWFHAMYLMTATRNGVSAKELERQLGVTYKCAWRIGHELRKLMGGKDASNPPLSGHVEVDETYVGGYRPGTRGRGAQGNIIVFGMLERDGNIKGHVVHDVKRSTLQPIIIENVAAGSAVSSDELRSYKQLTNAGYQHGTVKHGEKQYVSGIHHVNGVEGFWSHFKRGIVSTHVHISSKHAQNYVNEFGFRYNNRKNPSAMFNALMDSL